MEETGEAEVTNLGQMAAPWGKELLVQSLRYRSGLRLARLRIREGSRFTVLDVDAPTASWLAATIAEALQGGGEGGRPRGR